MKKTLKTIILFSLIALMLLANLAIVASATAAANDSQIPLEQRLVGTWRWESQHSWIVVFRADGTMLDGPRGLRANYNWMVVNDRLFVDGEDWNVRFIDDNMILDRLGRTYIYFWYSDSTEGETSFMLIWIIAIVILAVIGLIVFLIVFLIVRKNRRKDQQMQPQPPGL